MAGESADELASRQRDKAARLLRSAELYERGADGERRTAEVLDELVPFGYVSLHDLKWPGRPRANIDHVLVGPSGVYVIDSKNWSGRVVVAQGTVLQNRRRRDTAVASCGEAALALVRVLSTDVLPVLCLVRDEEITGRVQDVRVCTTSNLRRLILARPAILSVEQVNWVVASLRQQVPVASGSSVAKRAARRRTVAQKPKPAAPRRTGRRSIVGSVIVAILALMGAYGIQQVTSGGVPKIPGLHSFDGQSKIPIRKFGQLHRISEGGAEVRVKVGTPRNTEPAVPGSRVSPGTRLVSVPVSLHNVGTQAWRVSTLVRWRAEDSLGNQAAGWMLPNDVKSGKRLPGVRAVWPGRPKVGVLVFEVPRGQQLEAITIATGILGEPTAMWSRTG